MILQSIINITSIYGVASIMQSLDESTSLASLGN